MSAVGRRRQWALAFLVVGAVLALTSDWLLADVRRSALTATVVAVASVTVIARSGPRGAVTLGSVYAALFALFHCGLLASVGLGVSPALLNAGDARWLYSGTLPFAALVVALGQCAFTTAYLLTSGRTEDGPVGRDAPAEPAGLTEDVGPSEDVLAGDGAGIAGNLLLLAGIALWTFFTLSSGVSVLTSTYVAFLAATSGAPMPYAYLLIGLGFAAASASRRPRSRALALAVFSVWAVPALALGLRGEVIIPAAAYLVVLARRREVRLTVRTALVAVAVLAVGSLVRIVRQFGVAAALDLDTLGSAGPLSALTELGYSIRPLIVVRTFELGGEPFVGGGTYLAPIRRVVADVLGLPSTPAGEDPVVFSTMIAERAGPIGGSVAAEAYRSGGTITVVAVLALLGVLVARLDSAPRGPYRDAAVGMVAYSLLLWVRNDVTPVPLQLGCAVAVLCMMWLLSQRVPVYAAPRRAGP